MRKRRERRKRRGGGKGKEGRTHGRFERKERR